MIPTWCWCRFQHYRGRGYEKFAIVQQLTEQQLPGCPREANTKTTTNKTPIAILDLETEICKHNIIESGRVCRKCFLPEDVSFTDICQKQDNNLFSQILSNENHVLHQLLPPVRNIPYSLRPRAHTANCLSQTQPWEKNFITIMLYSKQ